jgi:hypothetical protein
MRQYVQYKEGSEPLSHEAYKMAAGVCVCVCARARARAMRTVSHLQ